MGRTSRNNLYLGIAILVFAAVLLVIWIPLDVQTGLIEKIRRQVVIGDALAPTVAAFFLVIGGGLLVLTERNSPDQANPSLSAIAFTALLVAVICVSLVVMRYAGPAAVYLVNAVQGGELEYRLLRDTAPWKYIGFFLGGTMMISGIIMMVEGRVSTKALSAAILAVIVMIIIYDVPFDDLLLPPNGDV